MVTIPADHRDRNGALGADTATMIGTGGSVVGTAAIQ
jgi:hypothetical protein